jgi:hypothetical protein
MDPRRDVEDSDSAPAAVGPLLSDADGPRGEEGRGAGGRRVHRAPGDFDPSSLPVSFDWRVHLPGSVGPVKDQGFCGSCWAFSFASSLESNWYVATGRAVDVPEQFVVDCAWDRASHACDGGEYDSAAHTIVDRFRGLVPTREFGSFSIQCPLIFFTVSASRLTENDCFAQSANPHP